MTGAQVKLGVLKPIDLREILNWARICGGQEWKNRVAYPAIMGHLHSEVMIFADQPAGSHQ
jgi:hypothetical protein